MSYIHKESTLAVPADLELFRLPPTDPTHQETEEVPYRPTTSVAEGGNITFEVPGSAEEYIKLAHTGLTFGIQVTDAQGQPTIPYVAGNPGRGHNFGPINAIGHSMFRKVTVHFGTQMVSSNGEYPYTAYTTMLLGYGQDAQKSHLTCALFDKDQAGRMDAMPHAANSNEALERRRVYLEGNKTCYFRIRLHCDVFNTHKLLPNMVGMRVELVRASPAFCLMAPSQNFAAVGVEDQPGFVAAQNNVAPNFNIKIVDPILWVTKVKLLPSVMIGHVQGLENMSAKYNFTRTVVKTFTLPAGTRSHSFDNVFSGQLPKRIFYFLVRNDAYNGSYGRNPFNFQHCNLTQANVVLNGKSFPSTPHTPIFTGNNANFMREFYSLFDSLGIHHGNKGLPINRNEYPEGFCMYSSDLTSNRSAGNGAQINLIKQGTLGIKMQFSDDLDVAYTLVTVAELDAMYEIDKMRNVSALYAV